MTRALIVLIIAAAIVVIVWLIVRPPSVECIQPPALTNQEQTDKATNLANTLKSIVDSSAKGGDSDSKFKANFSNALRTQYDELNDENVTLFLFSKAIDCYLQRNTPTSNEVAKQMTQLLIDRRREKQGAEGMGVPLTPGERGILSSDPNGKKALEVLDRLSK